jgi:predicted DNA-binding transcriptional regulator AlpA
VSPTPVLWTSEDVAKALQVSTDTVERWRASGEGPPALKLGKKLVRYIPDRVVEWTFTLEDRPQSSYQVEGAEA